MLTSIREKATGWIAWVIVILITIPFALWGINSYFEGESNISVAQVNGNDISAETYQQQLGVQRQALAERLGGNFDPALLDTLGIRQNVLDGLIDNQLLREYTETRNFRISDEHLGEIIRSFPAFQRDGQFDEGLYTQVLLRNRLTPQGFEASQRVNGSISQLSAGISESAFSTSLETERLLALGGQSRIAEYIVIDAAQLQDGFSATEEEIASYYEKNAERFQTEERMKVDFIELSVEQLSENIVLDEEDLRAHFEQTSGRYRQAESRQASHILISAGEATSEEDRAKKLEVAQNVLQQAQDGADFAQLAEEYSEDPGSSRNGGDLGVIARGQMVKPFEDAVYSMDEGDIAGPIETDFGYHIIKLTALQPGREQTFEEVRSKVEADAQVIEAERQFAELAESFKNLVFEAPEDITVSAEELDLVVGTSDWFTRDAGSGIVSEAAVRRAAFSEDVAVDGLVSQAVEIGFDRLIAVQKASHEPVRPRSIEEVRDEISVRIAEEKSQARVFELGSELLAELESTPVNMDEWAAFTDREGLESLSFPETRLDIPADMTLLGNAIFSAPAPNTEELTVGGVVLENGNYAIYALDDVIDADPSGADEAIVSQVEQQLMSRDGFSYYNQFRAGLRDGAEIVINEDQL